MHHLPCLLTFLSFAFCLSLGWVNLIFQIKGTHAKAQSCSHSTMHIKVMAIKGPSYQITSVVVKIMIGSLTQKFPQCFIHLAPQSSLLQPANNKKDTWRPCVLHVWNSGWLGSVWLIYSLFIQPGYSLEAAYHISTALGNLGIFLIWLKICILLSPTKSFKRSGILWSKYCYRKCFFTFINLVWV